MNPFVYEEFATGELFCGRNSEIKTMVRYISDSKNMLLYSKRRFGKSTLINELFEHHLDTSVYVTIYIDLFDMTDPNDFARLLYKGIADALPFDYKQKLSELKSLFSRVNFSATVKPDGNISVAPVIAGRLFEELIEDAFTGLLAYLKKQNKKAVIAFDEFQQIAEIKEKRIDALLRKEIQKHHNISYIFSGSKKHTLSQLFSHYSKPLYAMATGIELGGINEKHFYEYVKIRLNKPISREVFSYLYKLAQSESKLIQHICYHLYYSDADTVTPLQVDETVSKILKESDGEYRMILDMLPLSQREALKAVAATEGIGLLTKETLQRYNKTKASMSSALKGLLQKEIIELEDSRYIINGRKFALWCEQLLQ